MRTRARLLDAAKEIFEENGFLEARISDITERAGLTHGSFYHYFDSKEQALREIAEQLDDLLSEPMESVILVPDSDASPYSRLHTALRQHLESYRTEARIMGIIEQVARYDEQVAAVRFARTTRHREAMANSIQRLQRRGLADANIDPVIAAAALGAMTERFAEMWLVQGFLDTSVNAAAETLATLIVNGLNSTTDTKAK